tara:strand:+ start:1880 stop:2032 length:153 start_codon:yes stop_codon:yes gene_type:complete
MAERRECQQKAKIDFSISRLADISPTIGASILPTLFARDYGVEIGFEVLR